MRCDLHVHTVHSGMCSVPVLRRLCRESYTDPLELYHRLRALGMSLVTVTDHDSIEAGEALCRFPDFFRSEEVTITLPSGTEAHIGVYDITERQHLKIQACRDDSERFFSYLDEQDIISSVNHPLSALTGRRTPEDFSILASRTAAMEVLNGAIPAATNHAASKLAAQAAKIPIAGSDGHTLRSAGRAYTEVSGARDKEEFLAGLRSGRVRIGGTHGGYWPLTRDVLSIVRGFLRERPAAIPLTPLLAALPLVMLINYGREIAFSRFWHERLTGATGRVPIPEAVA